MKVIIFSKDRAAQLHLLLESIYKNDIMNLFTDIVVLYTYSTDDFKKAYSYVENEFPSVEFKPEICFRSEVLELLYNCNHEFMTFMVDDMIMYRVSDFSRNELKSLFDTIGEVLSCVSLRLGQNTTHQYQTNSTTSMPTLNKIADNFLLWNTRTVLPTENFGYPLSTDGHIFRTAFIRQCLNTIYFDMPNNMEGNLQSCMSRTPALMACRPQSLFVNNVINRVQDLYPNKTGETINVSAEELNQAYLKGKRLDLNHMDFSSVIGCHQELEVFFE